MTPSRTHSDPARHGAIAWMVKNHVTPNILMIVCLVGGLFMAILIKKEVFPEFNLDEVSVSMSYPGASPEEVEQGIVLAMEEAIRGLEGVKELMATASEGRASVRAELLGSADEQKLYQDIQQEIARITTFPEDAEEPQIELTTRRRTVLTLHIYGDVSERVLRELTEQVRDRLLQDSGITQVDLEDARPYEVRVEVSQENLRAYDLTLSDVARIIRGTAIELPGGSIKTRGGEILLRMMERRDWAREFADIPVISSSGGSVLLLGDIAHITDNFEETYRLSTYNGQRSLSLEVYRVGDQTPIGVSDAVRGALAEIEADLPPGVHCEISQDRSDIYRQRLELLLKNGCIGLCIVLCLLGLFLEFKLAFWVTLGIPTAFLGAFLFLPLMGVTINMISMFAFIIALGIVVDDAIVAGENIYEYRSSGKGLIKSAVLGARDVSMPITFSILTNIVAFLPLYFVPGYLGKIWKVIPLVVITVFVISWVESLLILPAHLGYSRQKYRFTFVRFLHDRQQAFSRLFMSLVQRVYSPFLRFCIRGRGITVSLGLALLMVIIGYVVSGRMGLILMPRVESDQSVVTAVLPYGSALEKTQAISDRLVAAAEEVADDHGGDLLVEGIRARIEQSQVEVTVYLTDPDERPIGTTEFTTQWRARVGELIGLESLRFESDRGGPGSGAALTIELSHRKIDVLDRAGAGLAEMLEQFGSVEDIDDGYTPGKEQIDFRLKPEAHSVGLTVEEVGRQVRNAFYGAEALRQQRGRNEIKVKVRFPESQRVSEYDLEHLLIRTPSGRDVPLMQVAEVVRDRAYTTITRRDGRRTITVKADVEPLDMVSQVKASVTSDILPRLSQDYPGLSYRYEGRQADFSESLESLIQNFVMALLVIYVLLAIPFGSYTQPLVVMMAIPFGLVGAVIGHMIMGYSLSIISLMGIVALSGVVVNDALVMIDYANHCRAEGAGPFEAIHNA
ncbi:MAG: efflux RND transporter permease subunit, partial [Planctomycetota bacterium]